MKHLAFGFLLLIALCGCPQFSAPLNEQKVDLPPRIDLEEGGYRLLSSNGTISFFKNKNRLGESKIPLYDSKRKKLLTNSRSQAVWPDCISFHVYSTGSPVFLVLYEWTNADGICLQYAQLFRQEGGQLQMVDQCPVGVTCTTRLDRGERNTFVGFQYSIASSSSGPFILVHFDGYLDSFKKWDLVMMYYSTSGNAVGVNIENSQKVPDHLRLVQTPEQRRSYHWYGKLRFKRPNVLEWDFETPIFNAYQVDIQGEGAINIPGSPEFKLIPQIQ